MLGTRTRLVHARTIESPSAETASVPQASILSDRPNEPLGLDCHLNLLQIGKGVRWEAEPEGPPDGSQGSAIGRREEGVAMKDMFFQRLTRFVTNLAVPVAMLMLLCTAVLPVQLLAQRASQSAGEPLKLVLARQSTAAPGATIK